MIKNYQKNFEQNSVKKIRALFLIISIILFLLTNLVTFGTIFLNEYFFKVPDKINFELANEFN